MRPREGVLWNLWRFSGLSSIRWDQKLILPLEQYACCSAAVSDGEFNEDLNKSFKSHPKDFAVWQKLAEIFIVQCDFTGKITHPSSVINFRALQDSRTHTGKSVQTKQKLRNRNGMTWGGCASQKCFNLIDRKSFDFFAEHAGNPLNIAILPVKSPLLRIGVCYFGPDFWSTPFRCSISRVQWTSPNSGFEMWWRFCHPKIVSYQNIHAKMPFNL